MLIREGDIIADKYRLERSLARGGMGSVWAARHLQLDMPVAVKFLDAKFAESSEARARFEREAKAAALIQSPHVVHVHDYGVERSVPYIAMELLKGEDLGVRLHRERRLTMSAAAAIITQVAKALRKAHEAKIIHRDLKPANIFLTLNDDDEIVKVLDFGIAKMTSPGSVTEATATGIVLGSFHYMSPEQARGMKAIDHRSDLWSLGIIAYRAVVGQLPFPGSEMGDVIVKICTDPLPIPSRIVGDLGPEVDAFFQRALARNPAERFQSARDMAIEFASVARISLGPSSVSSQLLLGAHSPISSIMPPPPSRAPASTPSSRSAKIPPPLPPLHDDTHATRPIITPPISPRRMRPQAEPSAVQAMQVPSIMQATDEEHTSSSPPTPIPMAETTLQSAPDLRAALRADLGTDLPPDSQSATTGTLSGVPRSESPLTMPPFARGNGLRKAIILGGAAATLLGIGFLLQHVMSQPPPPPTNSAAVAPAPSAATIPPADPPSLSESTAVVAGGASSTVPTTSNNLRSEPSTHRPAPSASQQPKPTQKKINSTLGF